MRIANPCIPKLWLRGLAIGILAAGLVAPASGTTLIRAGLEKLTSDNEAIVVGEVVDAYSYWTDEGTFILTDVRIAPTEMLKGRNTGEITVTVMGGTVDGLTTLILAGAELVPGRFYVVFLDREDLPGAANVVTVRDHSQGVFELVETKSGLRAVSQASVHPLVPDADGQTQAPGGIEGLAAEDLIQQIRQLAGEVK